MEDLRNTVLVADLNGHGRLINFGHDPTNCDVSAGLEGADRGRHHVVVVGG